MHPGFEDLASTWDDDPMRVERARALARAVVDRVDLQGAHVVEDGCGTGLVGFSLLEVSVPATLTLIDPSPAMREQVARKIADLAPGRACVLEPGSDLGSGHDLVISSMVLHHVPDPAEKIRAWAGWVETGGHVAVADLHPEDGSFHGPDVDDVHRGFDPREVARWMEEAGLEVGPPTDVFVIEKNIEGGEGHFPVWLLIGRRR